MLSDQEYTVTGTTQSYTFPVFNIDPINCVVVYTYSMTEVATGGVVVSSFNGPTQTFTFLYTTNLDPLADPLN